MYRNTSSFSSNNTTKNQSDNMKVMIRVRPPLPRETEIGIPFRSIAEVSENKSSLSLVEYLGTSTDELERQHELIENPSLFQLHRFTFDYVFDIPSTQEFVYNKSAKPAVESVLEGYNSTIFAYGQTGTGKTYTMEGFTYNSEDPERGIVPRCIEDIFNNIETVSNSNTKFIIRASYLQLYNENISDLLKPEKQNLNIREDKKRGIYVDNLSDWVVRNPNDIYALLEEGASCRATSSTLMNDVSSRSHAIFIITVEQMTSLDDGSTITKIGKLNLVDLAGSERIRVTGAKGKQLEESKRINKSLSALGNVINALTDPKGSNHIPYRDSKLTRLLADSLGGNCKTTMITMISPCHDFFSESLSSLLFSKRAKNIRNRPIVNQDLNHRALISQYEIELRNLKNELEEKNRLLQSNELLMELEEQKKKAEQDKKEVLRKLEQTSKQYLLEREEKNKLEMKISMMSSQMITGGQKIEDTPQFRSALEERQTLLLKEFDNKIQEFEKERQQLEEDKVEVERYKQLLLKQRDIMIALTTKLNERDETIVQLQEEIEAYDKINHQQEDLLEMRLNNINILVTLCKENNIQLPNSVMSVDKNEENVMNNSTNKKGDTKKYLTYEAEKSHNNNEYDNYPLTMLNADEKIKELKVIIKEQENEINILKLVSQKLISTSCDSDDGKVDINSVVKSLENGFELHNRIREIEQEKISILQDFEKQNEIMNSLKNENELLIEQNSNLEKLSDRNERELLNYCEIINNSTALLTDILNSIGDSSLKSQLLNLHNILNISGQNQIMNNSMNRITPYSASSSNGFTEKGMFSYPKQKQVKNSSSNKGLNTISSFNPRVQSKMMSDTFISKFINAGK